MEQPDHDPLERILLVDDNPINLQILIAALDDMALSVSVAESGEQALEVAKREKPTLVLLDIMMPPGIDGFEVCRRLKKDSETQHISVVFLTALDEVSHKVRGFELGAADFITMPFQQEEVRARVRSQVALQRLRRQLEHSNDALRRELDVAQELLRESNRRVAGFLLGKSEAVCGLRAAIEEVAARDAPVLLVGPAGAGHEAVARAIHYSSDRRLRPFITFDCAAPITAVETQELLLVRGLIETADFSRDEARADYEDKLAVAHEGTLFLSHLEQLPLPQQEQLCAQLVADQQRRDSGQPLAPDVRIIAVLSNKAGRASDVADGLSEVLTKNTLRVPSLVERRDDIPELADFFMRQQSRWLGKQVREIAPEAMKQLLGHDWPGNVRDLRGFIERQVAHCENSMLSFKGEVLAGATLGRYQLLHKLGAGAMGEVWQARHRMLAHPAAVKLVRHRPQLSASQRERDRRRFLREARVTANLRSVNTVQLHDFGIDERDGTYYYVMELLSGITLDTLVSRFGPLDPARVAELLKQTCRSLTEAHEAGLVHRDIKPHNLMVCQLGIETDVLKVLDFGVVKETLREPAGEHTVVGTPGFIAPEILTGGRVDSRADLYSLGCVAYLLIAGEPLFRFGGPEVAHDHLNTVPSRPLFATWTAVPDALEELVASCLSKDPAARPASARVLLQRLEAVRFEPPWTQEQAQQWWRLHLAEFCTPIGA